MSQTTEQYMTLEEAAKEAQEGSGAELSCLPDMERPDYLDGERWEEVLEPLPKADVLSKSSSLFTIPA